eukprot:scaffold3912_cov136-Amphora_coffeaeformis.AAC.4
MSPQTPPKLVEAEADEGFGLPLTTQKQLLLDIKANGGLRSLSDLESICDKRPGIYGDLGTSARKKVQNKVNYLKTGDKAYQRLQLKIFGSVVDQYSPTQKKRTNIEPFDLSASFHKLHVSNTMSMSRFFGQVKYDDIHQVKPQAWKNRGVMIWKSKDVSVGQDPTISTDVYTILLEGIDPRFFTIKNFQPFQATQTAANEIVVERPAASFDFLFGKFEGMEDEQAKQVQEELEDDEKQEVEKTVQHEGYTISRNHVEQKAYVIQHNDLTTTDDGEEPDYNTYLEKIAFQFPESLNYQLIYPNAKLGMIDYGFTAGDDPHSCGVKFRITIEPTSKRIVKKQRKNKNRAQGKFGRFILKHAEKFDGFDGMKEDEDEDL